MMKTKTLDLGCGGKPKNPFKCDEVYGIDLHEDKSLNILKANLSIEPIPFEDNYFESVSAYDFIEHVPRIIFNPEQRFCFVELMSEIYRVLKPGGAFFSETPAYPAPEAFQDPTHVNIITDKTMAMYFCHPFNYAKIYGFKGQFIFHSQKRTKFDQNVDHWVDDPNGSHLSTIIIKPKS